MAESDTDLLRRFEPVLRFTRGEWFLPIDAERFVHASSLWERGPYERPVQVHPEGALTLEQLGDLPPPPAGATQYLRLVDPEDELQAAVSHVPRRPAFRAGRGRLARVGYLPRIVDALFSLSLLGRGRVPRLTAHVARHIFQRMRADGAQPVYHGRVVRTQGWTVLQYWLLYPFNNWRTGFHGANDHEGDWELVAVYLAQPPGQEPAPEWVACAAHNERGGDLRRRWDDPELERIGEHPVVWVGAGSHASYFRPGEYLTRIELGVARPLTRVARAARSFWQQTLHQYAGETRRAQGGRGGASPRAGSAPAADMLMIPFVDYARGDGDTLGPGQTHEWAEPRVLSPTPGWVSRFRGLWGMDARDPMSGENAPSGPMYQGDGRQRQAWYDPTGWCGLSGVSPSHCALETARGELARLQERQTALETELAERHGELQGVGAVDAALRDQATPQAVAGEHRERATAVQRAIDGLHRELGEVAQLHEVLTSMIERMQQGEREHPRAHLQRPAAPTTAQQLRLGRVAEAWAATSAGLFVVVFALLLVFERDFLLDWLAVMVAVFLFIEAALRGWLTNFVTYLALLLAAVATIVLLVQYFIPVVVGAVIAIGMFLLWQNVRELRG
jgi:hypothetical protein